MPVNYKSLSARRAWIEMPLILCAPPSIVSLSARRAWIEIMSNAHGIFTYKVALRKESVDRNKTRRGLLANTSVALRKESVDRNTGLAQVSGVPSSGRSPQGERG